MLGSIPSFFDGNKVATICIYFTLMIVVTLVTTLLERITNVLKVKAKLSDGFVAGILLGAITSLPELITCLTSIIENKSGAIGAGDIFGSNNFDLFIMSICLLSCIWLFIDKKVSKVNCQSLICVAISSFFCFLAILLGNGQEGIFHGNSPLVWHGFNFFSFFILGAYVVNAFLLIKSNKTNDKPLDVNNFKSILWKWKLNTIILLLVLVASALVLASVFLTYCSTSLIKVHWGLSEGFGGALLLGVVTSLPEIVCCVNLCLHKEYNMIIDTMVGSCSFNLFILGICNVVLACLPQIDGPMYDWSFQNILQLVIGFITLIMCGIYFLINSNRIKQKLNKRQMLVCNAIFLSFVVLSYFSYIIISFIFKY